jgi:hypothetical protein
MMKFLMKNQSVILLISYRFFFRIIVEIFSHYIFIKSLFISLRIDSWYHFSVFSLEGRFTISLKFFFKIPILKDINQTNMINFGTILWNYLISKLLEIIYNKYVLKYLYLLLALLKWNSSSWVIGSFKNSITRYNE